MFSDLKFDNLFTRSLPADPIAENRCRQVLGACYSRVKPQRVSSPELVAYADEVVEILGLSDPLKDDASKQQFTDVFSGNKLLPDMDAFAMCYGGHQFGNWAGQLGDGRAIILGEVINQQGQRYTLQLKGAGPTPYSRDSDGLAVLRSSMREFLCSEAMHHLGVPTTRALSLITSGELVRRDMFYDGNAQNEPGAIVCRVAPSFLRFGNFEILASREEFGLLKQLADYSIRTDFPHLGEPSKSIYAQWFDEICRSTADMVVEWMRVGFVHGVMNTDNMSILGLTIDYGPYGWLEDFDLNWTPNTTDAKGRRYRFGAQPEIALWNLAQLGNALYTLIEDIGPLQTAVNNFKHSYTEMWRKMMCDKLGLFNFVIDTDIKLFEDLENVLQLTETDMTIFYRRLAEAKTEDINIAAFSDQELVAPIMDAFYTPDDIEDGTIYQWATWMRKYLQRLQSEKSVDADRKVSMNTVNPKYVLRNYLAQLAIDKSEQGDHSEIHKLQEILRHPYDEQPEHEIYAEKRPDWARNRAGCSMLSCSS